VRELYLFAWTVLTTNASQTIAPIYTQLASQFPQCIFLRVDVDQQKPIAAKYGVSAMPTFIAIKSGAQAPGALVRGADAQGLRALVVQHAGPNPPVPPLPADAEAAKAAGNAAFAAGDYAAATEHYTRALALAPKSAQLLGNRSFAHMKRYAQTKDAELRTQAMQDARQATVLDGRWGKGWVRLGEVCVAEADDADPTDHPDGKRKALEEAEEAFTKAVGLSEGKVKTGPRVLRPCSILVY
jgi:thioredoxin-like negative regulator of GroEL